MAEIPDKPRQEVSVDIGGHYNLADIDKRTRCLDIVIVYSTAEKHTKDNLKKMPDMVHLSN